jgi:pimeloyl-[acyl-carrier protein] methyl ester esterase
MSLYVETMGSGPDLVLLHGWGLHSGLFHPVIDTLAEGFRLHLIDLPGHGRSSMIDGDYTLCAIAAEVAEQVPQNSHWLGWSLGGRVVIQGAADGHAINRLILVGNNPCFIQKEGWPHAMPENELQQFADALQNDYRQTLLRFLAVQSRGSERGREELRELRSELFAHGEPHAAALAGGLEILRRVDLRPLLATIEQPTLVLTGSRDTLAPLAAAKYSAAQLPHGELRVIEGAGHAPFISHPAAFIAAVEAFLHE